MQTNWLTTVKAKEVETAKHAPAPAQPTKASGYPLLATQPSVTQSSDVQSPKHCAKCTPTGKICPNEIRKK